MVRFGFIGTNWITDSFIDAAQQINEFKATAVYSRTEEKANQFADKRGIAATYTNLETFANSEEIDAVYIASPNAFHAEQAMLCMKSGKHVIVEKAMASNAAEVKEMIQTAKENNVLLMEAIKTTHMPNFEVIRANLDKIGTVRRYFASYCQYSSRYDAYKQGTVLNAFKPELSNGSLMDIGIYCIFPMISLFGKPTDLKANSYMLDSGVDGQGSILFDYADQGINGMVMYSKISNSYVASEIQGEKGSIIMDNISQPQHVEIKYNDGTTENLSQEQKANTMYYEAKHFIELIENNRTESDVNTYKNSLITAEVLEEARKQFGLVFPADQ
ncbi:Gfo/Idh/MocA family protein [Aquibacillus sediminis]|uniref:Gfo/Idh/MocA family protein n=1 Tax=Aquibacillus sediminis TaxID=2574734 RepID=UPI0011087000|nr:Gfo/Idh/MocA family oxidoreductase [Aquibacillus sediminis]